MDSRTLGRTAGWMLAPANRASTASARPAGEALPRPDRARFAREPGGRISFSDRSGSDRDDDQAD